MTSVLAREEYRDLDPGPFADIRAELSERSLGKPPKLEWLSINKLLIDPSYQREIGRAGRKNIARIAREFDWAKFAPAIVAPAGGGRYVLVDGQHRTMAAILRGLERVPCQIIDASRAEQAAAFAAINGNITQMSPMQIRAAKIAAGDDVACGLVSICTRAGVTILRYPIQTKDQKRGDTMAVSMLYRMLGKFGPEVLETALSCITRTRDGYPGLVRSQLVEAFCVNLEASPDWRENGKLLKAVTKLNLRETFAAAGRAAKAGSGSGIVSVLVDLIGEHLEKELG